MYITKETKWKLSCRCHYNSSAAGPVLLTTKIPRFHLTQELSTPNNLIGRFKTMWEPCLYRGRPLSYSKRLQTRIFIFYRKRLEERVLPWQQYLGVILFLLWCTFLVPSLKITAQIFSGDILNLVFYRFSGTIYDVITFLICIIQKRELISYLLRFSDRIDPMKNSYGNFFIQSQSRIDFLTRGKSRFIQSEISCQNESVISQTRSRFWRLFNLHSQKFVGSPQVYSSFLENLP